MVHKERFKLVSSVYSLFIKDGKILLSRRFNTGYEDGNYGLPAGHAEEGETLYQSLAREVIEEIGIKINSKDLEHVLTMHRNCGKGNQRVDFFFKIKKWKGEPKNMETNKCDDLKWFKLDKLPKNIVAYIKEAIKAVLKEKKFVEFGW